MSEKTLGQIAYGMHGAFWDLLPRHAKDAWEKIAQAVAEAVRAESQWQPIETAPNGVAILVAYDNGDVDGLAAEYNDYDWEAYDGRPKIGFLKPTHWMLAPQAPINTNKE